MFRDALQSDRRLAEKLDRINTQLRRVDATAGLGRVAVVRALAAPVVEVSRNITAGNVAVFAELGPLFSMMCIRFREDTVYDAGTLTRLLDELNLKSKPIGGPSLCCSPTLKPACMSKSGCNRPSPDH